MAIVETNSFRLVLPESWALRETSPRAVLEGPAGASLVLSSFSISGQGSAVELTAVRNELRENLVRTFHAMPSDGTCAARTELQKFDSPRSEEFYQQLFQSTDGEVAIGLFGLLNGSNALLATLECPVAEHQSLLDVANYLDRIEWVTPTPPSKKSAWKFWQ